MQRGRVQLTGRDDRRWSTPAHPEVGPIEVAVFLAELVLLVALGVAGAHLAAGAAGVLLAVLLPIAAVTIWQLVLAPRAVRRIPYPGRLVGKLVLTVITTAVLAVAGLFGWSVVVLVVTAGLFTLGEVREARQRETREAR